MPSRRVTYRGITYDSKAELGYHLELLDRQRQGLISEIELQPTWDLYAAAPTGPTRVERSRVGKYTADYRYYDVEQAKYVVVDIKGQVPKTVTGKNGTKRRVAGGKGWTAFRLRCELLKANHGIEVQVVEGAPYTKLASRIVG